MSKLNTPSNNTPSNNKNVSNTSITDSKEFFELAKLTTAIPYSEDREFYHETITHWKQTAFLHLALELIITGCVVSGPRRRNIDEIHFKTVFLLSKSLLNTLKRYVRSQVSSMTTSYNMSHIAPFVTYKTELESYVAKHPLRHTQ